MVSKTTQIPQTTGVITSANQTRRAVSTTTVDSWSKVTTSAVSIQYPYLFTNTRTLYQNIPSVTSSIQNILLTASSHISRPGCVPAVTIGNASLVAYSDTIGQYAVYTCNQGYVFDDGRHIETLVCLNGSWHARIPECQGMSVIVAMNSFVNNYYLFPCIIQLM